MSDYTPPEGWRVKGDDEVVTDGDRYSHDPYGDAHRKNEECLSAVGKSVGYARGRWMPNGGYILTPIVSSATPQPDVSQEQQTDDGWEIYEPVKGELYSPGTQWKGLSPENSGEWITPPNDSRRYVDDPCHYIYRRPIQKQQPARKSLDVHLPEIERKINLASKDRPELLDWWRAEKERIAIEAGKRMGGAK